MHRFRNLVQALEGLGSTIQGLGQIGRIRYKPIYNDYISCIHEFRTIFLDEYSKLNLEEIELYGKDGRELFTGEKLSTLLHQSKSVLSILESRASTYDDLNLPNKVTLSWLWKHVPARFWLWSLGIMIIILGTGISLGQFNWIKELFGIKVVEQTQISASQFNNSKPNIELFYNGIKSSNETIFIKGVKNKPFEKYSLFKGFHIKNVGNNSSGEISINVCMSLTPEDEAEVDGNYMEGATWREIPSTDEEYIYSAKLQRTIKLNRGESYTIPSFGFKLGKNDQSKTINFKIEIFYGGEDPTKALFTYQIQ